MRTIAFFLLVLSPVLVVLGARWIIRNVERANERKLLEQDTNQVEP